MDDTFYEKDCWAKWILTHVLCNVSSIGMLTDFFGLRVIVRSITSPYPHPKRIAHLVGEEIISIFVVAFGWSSLNVFSKQEIQTLQRISACVSVS